MLTDILKRVAQIDERVRLRGSRVWYRGHRRSDWKLNSLLHRHVEEMIKAVDQPFSEKQKLDLLREEAKTIYNRFRTDAWPLLRAEERSEWGVIFTMQHYSIPTRLLDWSESFACALFFAQRDRRLDDTAAVWALDTEALNRISVGIDGMTALPVDEQAGMHKVATYQWHPAWAPPAEPLPTIAVVPFFSNPRMTAQRSGFLLSGDSFQGIEELWEGRLIKDGVLEKIELGPETYEEIDEYLRIAGVNAFTFFPDLDGLAMKHKAVTVQQVRDTHAFLKLRKNQESPGR